jgi:ATP-dependent helicase/DNAse subunit B
MKKESKDIIKIGDVDSEGLLELSFSKVKQFRRCKKKYHYKYVQGLKKRKAGIALRRGSWLHECLETHYRDGNWKIGYNNYKKENWDKLFDEEKIEEKDLPDEIQRIMEGYLRLYEEKEKELKIVAVEQDFKIRIPGTPIVLVGIIDLLAYDDMGLWVIDHKTVKRVPDEELRLTDLQLSLYYWVMTQIKKEMNIPVDKIAGVMFNYLRTKTPTIPQELKRGGLSKNKRIDTDYYTYYNTILEHELDPNDYVDILNHVKNNKFYERKRLPKSNHLIRSFVKELLYTGEEILKNNHYPRNPHRDCSWDCDYKNLCIADLHGHDTKFMIEQEFEKRDDEDKEEEEE